MVTMWNNHSLTTNINEVFPSKTRSRSNATIGCVRHFDLKVGFDQFFVVGFDNVRVSTMDKE